MNAPSKMSRWMKLSLAAVAVALSWGLAPDSVAQDTKPSAGAIQAPAATPEQEGKLIATLTNATLKGRWAPIKDGQLGPEKEDAYQIVSVTKGDGDKWQVNARLQYGGRSVDLPIPALVKWSGDTPVLLFDNVNLGGPRSYSARLMVYENTYAGTWSGGDHGGMLYGVIVHESHCGVGGTEKAAWTKGRTGGIER
jgi:hypothetical protein